MTTVKKNDFIELEFTGRTKDNNEVFDTNIKEVAEKSGFNSQTISPLIISVGNSMSIKGLDKSLEGKEVGKTYTEEFPEADAFGKRNPQMVKMIPLKMFLAQKVMPEKGMQLSLDGMLVKILSVSGGRVLVDFNNPLSGKAIIYEYTIKRIVTDMNEKVNSLQEFFFRNKFEFDIDETNKAITFKVPANVGQYMQMFAKQFNDILGMKILAKEPAPASVSSAPEGVSHEGQNEQKKKVEEKPVEKKE